MDEPVFSVTTERIYARLPALYRAADKANDYSLKRWISGFGDALDPLYVMINRFNYVPPDERLANDTALDNTTYERPTQPADPTALPIGQTSDLVDPKAADSTWLPWLAQLTGARLRPGLSDSAQRQVIESGAGGWAAGSRQSMVAAMKTCLSGPTYFVEVDDHYDGDQWQILITVNASEQSDVTVLQAAADLTKPAGLLVNFTFILMPATEPVGWTEAWAASTNACFFPSDTLYPSDTLIPC